MKTSALSLKDEERLFVLIADSSMQEEDYDEELRASAASLLGRGFDWRRFMKLAGYHHYEAAVARFFKDVGMFEELPEEVGIRLENEYILSQARFLKKEHELLDIVRGMEEHGIDLIVLKGIPLANALYRDPGVRALKDIDILVSPSATERGRQVLVEQGYSLYTGCHPPEDYRKYHFHYVFGRGESYDSVVELHWDVLPPMAAHCSIDRGEIEGRVVPVQVGNRTLRTFSLPLALWHMSVHASQKEFLSFRSLTEMKGILRRLQESEWESVLAWSAECNTMRELTLAINLSEVLSGGGIGARVKRDTRPGFVLRRFVLSMYYPRALVWEWIPFAATHELVIGLFLRKGFADKLKYLYHLVFPDQATLFNLYYDHTKGSTFENLAFHLNGFYVLLKVACSALCMGFCIQSRIIGDRMIDPEKHKSLQPS